MIAFTRRQMNTGTTIVWAPSTASDTTSTEWLHCVAEWIEVHGELPRPSDESDAAEEPAIIERQTRYGPARNQTKATRAIESAMSAARLRGVNGSGRPRPSYNGSPLGGRCGIGRREGGFESKEGQMSETIGERIPGAIKRVGRLMGSSSADKMNRELHADLLALHCAAVEGQSAKAEIERLNESLKIRGTTIMNQLGEIQRLQKILSHLPKTKEGHPMYPGLEVFGTWEGTSVVHNIDGMNGAYVKQPGGVFWRDGSECSSVPMTPPATR